MRPREVTIIVTSFNQSAFLPDAVGSALGQSIPCEVLVIDDGSTDDSVSIARSFGIRVIAAEHRGVIATYRAAVAAVETPFHMILNGDDYLDPRFVELTLPRMADPAVGFVYTGFRYFGAREETVRALPFEIGRFLWNNRATVSSLTRQAAYSSTEGFSEEHSQALEDWRLWVDMLAAGWRADSVDQPLLFYRQYNGFTSRNAHSVLVGYTTRLKLLRRHPLLYLRNLPAVAVEAARSALSRVQERHHAH